MNDATLLLNAVEHGDPTAPEKLLVLVYGELRRLATFRMSREPAGHTLQPTALVHEVWLRLMGNTTPRFENRAHFFSAAAEAMRRILIDRARSKLAQRHGGGAERVNLDAVEFAMPEPDAQVVAVHEALDKLAAEHPRQAELVKLRYFGGLTIEETAQLLGISVSTAKNDWTFSRTWLFREIRDGGSGTTAGTK
jgi:RNA polymerase sigma factor (TIGR02999 family)